MAYPYPPEFETAHRSYLREGNRDALSSTLEIWTSNQSVDDKESLGNVLHFAVSHGYLADVQAILDAGVSPTEPSPWSEWNYTPLFIAAESGQSEIGRLFWELVGPEGRLDGYNPQLSCLQVAAESGHAAFIADFLDMWSGWSADEMQRALKGAAEWWHDDVVVLLMARVAFPAEVIQDALAASIRPRCFIRDVKAQPQAVVSRLVDAGGNPNGTVSNGLFRALAYRPMLLVAADTADHLIVLTALLEKGADPNIQNPDDGLTALHQYHRIPSPAAHTIATAEMLFKHGASPDIADHEGETPVHSIALAGTLKDLELYLHHSRDADAALRRCNSHGESVLHYAAAGGNVDVVKFLVGRGLDVNAISNNGWTPLLCALMPVRGRGGVSRAVDIANFLLQNSAVVDTVTGENWTPMHAVASWESHSWDTGPGVPQLVRELISRGAALDVCAKVLGGKDVELGYGRYSVLGKWGVKMQRFAESESERVKEVVQEEDTAPHMWAFRNGRVDIFQAVMDHWAAASEMSRQQM